MDDAPMSPGFRFTWSFGKDSRLCPIRWPLSQTSKASRQLFWVLFFAYSCLPLPFWVRWRSRSLLEFSVGGDAACLRATAGTNMAHVRSSVKNTDRPPGVGRRFPKQVWRFCQVLPCIFMAPVVSIPMMSTCCFEAVSC